MNSKKGSKLSMKLISLNLRFGGQSRTESILNYLINHKADLIVLSEFKNNANGLMIKKTLKNEGYNFEDSEDKALGVLVASKHPFSLIRFCLIFNLAGLNCCIGSNRLDSSVDLSTSAVDVPFGKFSIKPCITVDRLFQIHGLFNPTPALLPQFPSQEWIPNQPLHVR